MSTLEVHVTDVEGVENHHPDAVLTAYDPEHRGSGSRNTKKFREHKNGTGPIEYIDCGVGTSFYSSPNAHPGVLFAKKCVSEPPEGVRGGVVTAGRNTYVPNSLKRQNSRHQPP